jgi:hypothetical protein
MMTLRKFTWANTNITRFTSTGGGESQEILGSLMKILFLILLSSSAFAADSSALYTSTSYYTAGKEKFRVEFANIYPRCKEVHRARRIFQHDKNELREIGIFKNGQWESGGPFNKPALRKEVDGIFAKSRTSGNPCKPPPLDVLKQQPPFQKAPKVMPKPAPAKNK